MSIPSDAHIKEIFSFFKPWPQGFKHFKKSVKESTIHMLPIKRFPIKINEIRPGTDKQYDEKSTDYWEKQIKKGHLPAVIAQKVKNGYELYDGRHRLKALRNLGHTTIPTIIWKLH